MFVEKKLIADDIASDLALRGIMCDAIHGDRDQSDREQAMREFRDGTNRILIATDVASRGSFLTFSFLINKISCSLAIIIEHYEILVYSTNLY